MTFPFFLRERTFTQNCLELKFKCFFLLQDFLTNDGSDASDSEGNEKEDVDRFSVKPQFQGEQGQKVFIQKIKFIFYFNLFRMLLNGYPFSNVDSQYRVGRRSVTKTLSGAFYPGSIVP